MESGRFPKREHICSTRLIDQLFGNGSQRVAAYPLRAVFRKTDRLPTGVPVQVLISVPKKHFKHAVDRNRVKRQIREAYRRHKQPLWDAIPAEESLLIGFIWVSDELSPSDIVTERIKKLLTRIGEKI